VLVVGSDAEAAGGGDGSLGQGHPMMMAKMLFT
jgi:hypothetical protein